MLPVRPRGFRGTCTGLLPTQLLLNYNTRHANSIYPQRKPGKGRNINTMAPSQRFANYPGAQEAPAAAFDYNPQVDQNPVVRGLPLVFFSTLFVFLHFPPLPSSMPHTYHGMYLSESQTRSSFNAITGEMPSLAAPSSSPVLLMCSGGFLYVSTPPVSPHHLNTETCSCACSQM